MNHQILESITENTKKYKNSTPKKYNTLSKNTDDFIREKLML